MAQTKRESINLLVSGLEAQRQRYEPFWKEVDRYIAPGLYRGQLTDTGRGERLDDSIIDSTATLAQQTLEAGFVAHVTPPGRQWHRFKLGDPDLAEYGPVARWLDDVGLAMFSNYETAGIYEVLQPMYGYMGGFGNSCLFVEEHYEKGIHARNIPVGSFWFGLDEWGMPNAFHRKLRLTVQQVVGWFGRRTRNGSYDWSNFSPRVRSDYDKNPLNPVDVGHVVYLNPHYNPNYADAREKLFASCYYEIGAEQKGPDGEGLFLRESGYDLFPALFGPWDQIGEDVYGYRCPGRTVLGDVKQLQDDVVESGLSIAQLNRPTLMGSAAAVKAAQSVGYLPGRMIPLSAQDLQQGGLKPIHEVAPRIAEIQGRIQDIRRQIERGYYTDVFRMLDFLEDRDRTATEIAARQEERLVQLVGVLNRLNRRVLSPLVERQFMNLLRQGKLPPIPEELEGQQLGIEMVSNMAQAMRSLGLGSIDRVLGTVAGIAEYYPEIKDKVDLDQVIDEVAKAAGAPARIIVDDETVAERRAARAKQMQALQTAEEAESAAKTAKTLSETATGENRSALNDILNLVRGGRA